MPSEAYLPVRAGESVVATCLTTTYFSHDLDPAGPASKPDHGEEIGDMMKPALSDNDDNSRLRTGRGLASAQSPSIIQNTRNTMNTVSSNATAASNEALGVHQSAQRQRAATHAPAKSSGKFRWLRR